MAFLDDVENLLHRSNVAGHPGAGAILTASATAEQIYVGAESSTQAITTPESTAQFFYLEASSSGAGIVTTSTAEAFYLTNESPVWLIYKGHMPDSTAINTRAIALLETAGGGVMGRIDMETPRLQVLVRGVPMHQTSTTYPEAESKMTDLVGAIHGYAGSALTTTHWAGAWCEDGPTFEGYDEGWRPQFSATFRVWRSTT